MHKPSTTLIAGAGIAGLTTAIGLTNRGFDHTQVIERRLRRDETGFGLNLSPHVVEMLQRQSILTGDRCDYIEGDFLHLVARNGRQLAQVPRLRRNGFPHIMIHRAELIRALDAKLRNTAGADIVAYGSEIKAIQQYHIPIAQVLNGSTAYMRQTDRLIVAAGALTQLRQRFEALGQERHNEIMYLWRGVAQLADAPLGNDMYVFGDDTSRFVMYPIRQNAAGTQVNWVAALPAQPSYRSLQRSTPTTAKAAIIDFFSDWTIGPVTVRQLLSTTQSLRAEILVDHPSLHTWFRDDVILVGDAAHPMLPMGSSGAGQAIADGITLAAALDDHPCNEAAFTTYQRQRLNRVNRLVELNRSMGPEQILTDYYRRSNGHGPIEDSFTSTELEQYRVSYQTALDDSFQNITSEGAARAV